MDIKAFAKTVGPVTVAASYTDALRITVTVFGIPVFTYQLTQEQLVHLGEDAIVAILPFIKHLAEHVGEELVRWFDHVLIDVGLLPRVSGKANPPDVIAPPPSVEPSVAREFSDLPFSKPMEPVEHSEEIQKAQDMGRLLAGGGSVTLKPIPANVKVMS